MKNSEANTRRATTTLAFRFPLARRRLLESIQADKGHAQISDTLREAVNEYIDRHIQWAA
jgi:hypothetical protein